MGFLLILHAYSFVKLNFWPSLVEWEGESAEGKKRGYGRVGVGSLLAFPIDKINTNKRRSRLQTEPASCRPKLDRPSLLASANRVSHMPHRICYPTIVYLGAQTDSLPPSLRSAPFRGRIRVVGLRLILPPPSLPPSLPLPYPSCH
ncbi:hypothetical protein BHM03_00001094 [Ensete ventricosum]|nr:hypothetical protein BHM03_00001094 [Ensete ventricosum]